MVLWRESGKRNIADETNNIKFDTLKLQRINVGIYTQKH